MAAKVQRGEVRHWRDLDAVAADAHGRLDRAEQPRLFDRLDWFRLTLAHCPPPGRLLVVRAEAGKRAAWAFLMVERGHARLLGSWYTLAGGVVHYPTARRVGLVPAASPLPEPERRNEWNGRPRNEPRVTDGGLIKTIIRSLRTARVHRLTFDHLPQLGIAPLLTGLRAAGWRTRAHVVTWSWTIDTSAGFDAYWAARPSHLRATVRRKTRAAALDIRILDRFDPAAWAAYEDVYRASWKPPEGAPAFLRAVAEQEGAAGTLRLGLAARDGRTLAVQLWLVEDGVATIHKLAHRRDADALSPGTILSAAMFRHAIEVDGVRMIDFGTGDEAYKADWMDRREPLYRVEAWDPRSLRGLMGFSRASVAELVRTVRGA